MQNTHNNSAYINESHSSSEESREKYKPSSKAWLITIIIITTINRFVQLHKVVTTEALVRTLKSEMHGRAMSHPSVTFPATEQPIGQYQNIIVLSFTAMHINNCKTQNRI